MNKIYNFTVPVSGYEHFSVKADSYEEALKKIDNEDYYMKPTLDDIDWDFGLGRCAEEYLPKAYTISEE